MTLIERAARRQITVAFTFGILGGIALVLAAGVTTQGWKQLLPYVALLVLTGIYLKATRVEPFVRRFNVTLTSFMLATLVDFLYIITVDNPAALSQPLWRIVWPLLPMLAIGTIVSAAVAGFSNMRST